MDFSGWIDANLLKYEGHKKPLGMKFALDKEGRVGMWYGSLCAACCARIP